MAGRERLIINTQERAISPDINRLQAKAEKAQQEVQRYLWDVTGNDDIDAGGVITEPNTLETPLRAEIAQGLLVRVNNLTTDLTVDPGVLNCISPAATADDSNYLYIEDAGIGSGTLFIAPNATGSIRIDVVECQPTTTITETDNRDIFNQTTGLFTAVVVNKAQKGTLTYRVRQGTAGGGYPGHALGWLPLCVASVSAGSTSNANVTFYDVRPILSDRAYGNANLTTENSWVRGSAYCDTVDNGGPNNATLAGNMQAFHNGRRVGGRLLSSVPGADVTHAVIQSNANWDPGGPPLAGLQTHVCLAFPLGLPRWARYTNSAPRLPRSPRGILVVSANTTPQTNNASIDPAFPVGIPAAIGLGSISTTDAVVLASTYTATNNIVSGFSVSDGKLQVATATAQAQASTAVAVASVAKFILLRGVHWPTNAKRIFGVLSSAVTVAAATGSELNGPTLKFYTGANNTSDFTSAILPNSSYYNSLGVGAVYGYQYQFDLAVPNFAYPATNYAGVQWITFTYSGRYDATASFTLIITGWSTD